MKRIFWDMEEAAVLLQGLLDVREGKVSRKNAIARVSKELRTRAIRRHGDIDEKFRNENGIDIQMAHLEYALTDGEAGWKPAYQWQYKILDIFHNEPETFSKLLAAARGPQPLNDALQDES